MNKIIFFIFAICVLSGCWFAYSEIYAVPASGLAGVRFIIKEGESVSQQAARLEDEGVIRSAVFFKLYLRLKGLDRKVNHGEFEVAGPATLARVVEALARPGLNERQLTIIPGWNLRHIVEYLSEEVGLDKGEFERLLGKPTVNYKITAQKAPELDFNLKILEDKPWYVSYEGYIAPETYRVYKDASAEGVIRRMLETREKQITDEIWQEMEEQKKTFFDVLTMASVLEKEVGTDKDMALVSDIFWRRQRKNWALQSCATVNYITGKNDPGVSFEDKEINSPYNTYKYPGLPLGPISSPGLSAIKAALYPKANGYWYFMTGKDGVMRYAETLEEHNDNIDRFLR